eukprot:431696-Amphidinium_carterae.1
MQPCDRVLVSSYIWKQQEFSGIGFTIQQMKTSHAVPLLEDAPHIEPSANTLLATTKPQDAYKQHVAEDAPHQRL